MTDEDAVRIGVEFRRLIDSHGFEVATELLRQHYKDMAFNTAPHEQVIREECYRRAAVFDDLLATIREFVFKAEQETMKSALEDDTPIIINTEY